MIKKMKALLKKASDWEYYKTIEVNTIEDLFKIYHSLIIENDKQTLDIYKDGDYGYDKDFEIIITIYDDYVE